jgi:hypothetical protein
LIGICFANPIFSIQINILVFGVIRVREPYLDFPHPASDRETHNLEAIVSQRLLAKSHTFNQLY